MVGGHVEGPHHLFDLKPLRIGWREKGSDTFSISLLATRGAQKSGRIWLYVCRYSRFLRH